MEKKKDNHQSPEENLWKKYDTIQKTINDKSNYYTSAMKYFKDVLLEIDKFQIQMALLSNNSVINKENLKESVKLNELYNVVKETINNTLEAHKKVIGKILNRIKSFISVLKKDKDKEKDKNKDGNNNSNSLFNEFKMNFNSYQSQLKKHNQIKDKFHESQIELENILIKQFEKKIETKLDIPKKNRDKIDNNLKKYLTSIEETKKFREQYIDKRDKFINFYISVEEKELKMYYEVLNEYLKCEKDQMLKYFNEGKLVSLKEKNEKKSIYSEMFQLKKKMKNFEKKDGEIKFENKTNINFDKCFENGLFDAYVSIVQIIKESFDHNIYSDINIDEEKNNYIMRGLIMKLFENEKNIKEEDKKAYINCLKNPLTHKTFIKVLNKLRTNSSFKRTKDLILLLGQSFIIILEEAEKKKDFWAAKNCLILSQTFCYEEEDENKNKVKIYPFADIKSNSWLSKSDFWLSYCYWMVDEELKKLVGNFTELRLEDIKEKKDFPPSLNNRISEVIFSQLLPLLSNMVDITKDKLNAIGIIETFRSDYIYLKEANINSLYDAISTDKNEIESLRNEYMEAKKKKLEEMKNDQIESQENKEQSFYPIPNKAINDEEDLCLSEIDSSKNLQLINNNIINNSDNNINIIKDETKISDDSKKKNEKDDKGISKEEKKEETGKEEGNKSEDNASGFVII